MPSALIFGALGSVGVELVRLLTSTPNTAVRAVDTSIPQLACISTDYKTSFDRVEFRQVNMSNLAAISACFDDQYYDVVFNCSATTKPDQVAAYYQVYIEQASLALANECKKRGIVMVHMSTGLFYKVLPGYQEQTESTEFDQDVGLRATYWTKLDKMLQEMDGLNAVIVRPGRMYGPTDTTVLAGNLCVAYLANRAQVECPIALDSEMPVYTVHTHDVARAMVHLAKWYKENNKNGVDVFNVADDGKHRMTDHVRTLNAIFPYKATFTNPPNTTPSAEEMEANRHYLNEMLMDAWLNVLAESNIARTPLSPYYNSEEFGTRAFVPDMTKLKSTGFECMYKEYSPENASATIEEFKKQGLWPLSMKPFGQ